MRLFPKAPLLRPKNATFCPGCPSKELQLNKEFTYNMPAPQDNQQVSNPKVSLLRDRTNKQHTSKQQTLF